MLKKQLKWQQEAQGKNKMAEENKRKDKLDAENNTKNSENNENTKVDTTDNPKEDNKEEKPKKKKREELEKIDAEKVRGRVIVFNPEKSELAKNLKLEKKGDYVKKKK